MAPARKIVKVSFPCVHGAAGGQLVAISSFLADELKGTIKVISGIDEQAAQRIIGSARYNEVDSRAASGIIASFSSPFFVGESYALSLAIADKMTRLDSCGKWETICATGSIPADGCGDVKRIRAFNEKVDLFTQHAQAGSLFVFPVENLAELSDEIIAKLNQLKIKGSKYIAVRNINDLEGVIWERSSEEKKSYSKNIQTGYQYLLEIIKRYPRSFLWAGYIVMFIFVTIITVIAVMNTTNEYNSRRQHEDFATAAVNKNVKKEPNNNTTKDLKHSQIIQQKGIKPAIESGDIDTTPY